MPDGLSPNARPQSFVACPVCGGKGFFAPFKSCPECRGLGRSFSFGAATLYWDWGLDALHNLVRQWSEAIQNLINALLLGILALNIFFIVRIVFAAEFDAAAAAKIIFISPERVAGPVWLLAFFNCYFFYRIYRQNKQGISYDAASLKQARRINVARAMSPALIRILDRAWNQVRTQRQFPIRPIQLFAALLADADVEILLARLGLSAKRLEESLARQIVKVPPAPQTDPGALSPESESAMLNAYLAANADRSKFIRTTDLLAACYAADEIVRDILYESNVDGVKINNVIKWVHFNKELLARYRRYRSRAAYKPKGPVNRAYTAAATPFLDSYSTDLTQAARAGQLPLTVAREAEFEEAFRILESGKSVVFVGEKGVGKSNIIEGLANRMAAEEVPPILQDKRLVSLSLPHLVAGAGATGEVQERMLIIIQEIIRSGNIILVIEGIDTLVGVSSVGTESIDLSEVLVQHIQSGSIWVMATATPANMVERIEHSALAGVLERVVVPEPDKNKAIQIVEAHVGFAEAKNKVFFTYEALEKIIEFSDRYLHDQFLPAKAIQLMNEVATWAAQRENKLIAGEDIAEIVSRKTNIPLTKVTKKESDVLLNLEAILHERVVGQDEAVKLVVSALKRARAELRDEHRPIATMLFLGPTGVGKTELAKTIADVYFGEEEDMIRLDMSEYQNQQAIGRLLGEPGEKRGGMLTEAVRAKPFALVLLDEIEKAHPEILNIFLQVMDDGRLTDSLGRTIDFSNTILVATSNAQAQLIQDEVRKNTGIEAIKEMLLRDHLRKEFRPEFLNRFDGIVVFKPLSADEVFTIAGLMLRKVAKRLEKKGIQFEASREAQQELATAGFDPMFGARPLRRVIQERVEEALANYLLAGAIGRRDVVVLNAGGKLEVKKATPL